VTTFFDEVLRLPEQVLLLEAQRRLEAMHPGLHVFHTRADLFRHDRFCLEQQATLEVRTEFGRVVEHWPDEATEKCGTSLVHRWDRVTWQSRTFDVVTLTLRQDCNTDTIFFVIGEDAATVQRFFLAVCAWCSSTRGEVLVFEEGHFSRSQKLHEHIEKTTFEDLILPAALIGTLRDDVRRFVAGRETYAKYRVPWKRGLLLLGPPGNGKTHTLRALVRETKWPCLYVKSFRGQHTPTEEGIARVFDRARRAAPCVLVLEDLDALIDDSNRSVLLNELDGFALNEGLLVVASTNHPERLDRSLLDRPSRFDRKFHFALPAPAERRRYLERWQHDVEPALRLSEAGLLSLVEGTHAFTFAYLKELTFGAMLAFMESPRDGAMDEVAEGVLTALKGEMSSARKMLPPLPDAERRISLS
jgi:ATPase family associated with various cellular activities (AAA)